MRLILMGTGPFAAPTFRRLVDSHHQVLCLFTRPVRPTPGRAGPPPSPVRALAEEAGLKIHAPENVNLPESAELLAGMHADVLVVCDYGQILKPEVLATTRLGGINLHGSLLPKYRGAAPVQWALLNGESETGVSVIHMTPKLDAGPILVRRRMAIGDDDDGVTLEASLAELGIGAVEEALEMLEHWDGRSPLGTPQDPAQATRAPRLEKADGLIDWNRSAVQIRNQVRGLKPWPGTYTNWTNEKGQSLRLIINQVSLPEVDHTAGDVGGQVPGTIVRAEESQLWVRSGDGRVLAIDQLQPAGKRPMSAEEFLRGHRCQSGQKLGRGRT